MQNKMRNRVLATGMTVMLLITGSISDSAILKVQAAQKVKSVSITSPETGTLYMKKGESYKIKTKVSPANAKNKKLKLSSSNKKVATVSANGKIKAKGNGTAKVTAVASGKKAVIKVKVVKNFKKVKSVSLDQKSATLYVGGSTLALSAAVSPKNATVKNVEYRTSDAKVASVSAKGVVTAKGEGTAKITALASDGRGAKAVCTVTVKKADDAQQTPSAAPSSVPSVAPSTAPSGAPAQEPTPEPKEKVRFESLNSYRSYAVVTYSLPEQIKVENIAEISVCIDSEQDLSVRLYAGTKKNDAAELTGATREVKETVTGTEEVTVNGTKGTKTIHQLEIQETSSTRLAVSDGGQKQFSLAIGENAKKLLAGEAGNERHLVLYPHGVFPKLAFYDLTIKTVDGQEYVIPLDATNVTAAEGGTVSFSK